MSLLTGVRIKQALEREKNEDQFSVVARKTVCKAVFLRNRHSRVKLNFNGSLIPDVY